MSEIKITNENKYNTKDIAKWVRQQIKKNYPSIKVSVTMDSYSGGSSISLAVMESKKVRFLKTFEEIDDLEILGLKNARNDTEEEVEEFIKNRLNSKGSNLNQYHLESDWGLTEEGKKVLIELKNILQKHNWDNSDAMTDYFDVNYYVDMSLGKWDKPFIDGVQ